MQMFVQVQGINNTSGDRSDTVHHTSLPSGVPQSTSTDKYVEERFWHLKLGQMWEFKQMATGGP